MVVDPWTLMSSGNFIGAVTASFTNVMGAWFYGAILFSIVAMVYLKTQNIGISAFVMLIVGISFSSLMPDLPVMSTISVLIVLTVAIVMYKLYTRG